MNCALPAGIGLTSTASPPEEIFLLNFLVASLVEMFLCVGVCLEFVFLSSDLKDSNIVGFSFLQGSAEISGAAETLFFLLGL